MLFRYVIFDQFQVKLNFGSIFGITEIFPKYANSGKGLGKNGQFFLNHFLF